MKTFQQVQIYTTNICENNRTECNCNKHCVVKFLLKKTNYLIQKINYKHNPHPNNKSMYEPLGADPAPIPSYLYTPPLNVAPHIKFYQPSFDDITPPDPPDLPFSLSMSPIKFNTLHTLTHSPIPMHLSYQHYNNNITINLDDTLLTPTPPKPPP